MPSTSVRQKRFMAAAAHSKEFAKKAGIDQKVAKEFNEADQKKDKGQAAHKGNGKKK